MARRRHEPKATFEDMPRELREISLDAPPELKRQRADWLETNNLSFLDFCTWRREQSPSAKQRPPARRKLLTPEQVAALDAEREREGGFQW